MSTPTKLGAKAANSLREKRRVSSNHTRSSSNSGSNQVVNNNNIEDETSNILEGSTNDSQAGSTASSSVSRSNVYSFFDPADIRKPPTSPVSISHKRTTSSSSSSNKMRISQAHEASFDDAASVRSHGSAATERIGNHKPPSSSDTSNNILPLSSAFIMEEREAKYEEGATDLFMLVEDTKWEDVCDRVEEVPSEARTWVVSSGTENTVFSWSVWRRLPLHEACRRQPPPVVVYSLLSAYPESAMAESNFGELPLHSAVRCGACAEVVNCILAAYPAGVMARDNSGCTPLDILNGTGKMMDHDAVVAALNRTIAVLTREEQAWEEKISSMQLEFKQNKDKRRQEYETVVATKNAEIEDLKRKLNQENLATSNLAAKVIQTEQVVQDKGKTEKRYQEQIKQNEDEIMQLKSSNATRKSKIKDLEDIVRSDRKAILELNNRVQTLQSSFAALVQEEETFATTKLVEAEKTLKSMMESQFTFIKETEKRKESLRVRVVNQLGIKIPPKKNPEEEEAKKKVKAAEQPPPEHSNNEVADRALASAMAHLSPVEDEN